VSPPAGHSSCPSISHFSNTLPPCQSDGHLIARDQAHTKPRLHPLIQRQTSSDLIQSIFSLACHRSPHAAVSAVSAAHQLVAVSARSRTLLASTAVPWACSTRPTLSTGGLLILPLDGPHSKQQFLSPAQHQQQASVGPLEAACLLGRMGRMLVLLAACLLACLFVDLTTAQLQKQFLPTGRN